MHGSEITIEAGAVHLTFFEDLPGANELRELQDWLAIEADATSSRLDPDVANALAVDALTIAAMHGVVGNFTYDLFPWAAQFVKRLRRQSSGADVEVVTARALAHARSHAVDPREIRLESLEQRPDRSWRAVISIMDGSKRRKVRVTVSESGLVVASRRE